VYIRQYHLVVIIYFFFLKKKKEQLDNIEESLFLLEGRLLNIEERLFLLEEHLDNMEEHLFLFEEKSSAYNIKSINHSKAQTLYISLTNKQTKNCTWNFRKFLDQRK
jgi:hypothetical protein